MEHSGEKDHYKTLNKQIGNKINKRINNYKLNKELAEKLKFKNT